MFAFLWSGCSPTPFAAAPTPTPTTAPTPTVLPTPTPDPDVTTFPNGHTVRGAFRRLWQSVDGAALFGAPLTEEHWVDGRRVQYFERVRLELADDGTAQLSALGVAAVARLRTPPIPAEPRTGCDFVAETQHNVCGAFRDLWARGGAALFGAPLTEAEARGNVLSQTFERVRLEERKGQPAQLAPLGDEALARVPGNLVLRAPAHRATAAPIQLTAAQPTVQPFEAVDVVLETGPVSDTGAVSDTATIFWGDTAGRIWPALAPLADGRAELTHTAAGALGPQGALVMIGGRVAGVTTELYRLDAASAITTGQPRFDELLPRVKAFMDQDISTYTFGTNVVRGYRSPDNNLLWLRDHVHQGKGYAYWEQDMTSLLDQFRRYQHPDGSFDDYLGVFDFGEVRGRKEVEADLEYLFVEGVYRAWQATGDDEWLRRQVTAMERGLQYATSDPQRWDPERRLVKRPYTVDTWDFEIGPPTISPDGKPAPRHWIDGDTKWSIFHGDNTGYAHAMLLLGRMYDRLGDAERAAHWRSESAGLMERLNALSWNGFFFRHMVPLAPVELPVDTEQQLSLSNAYALNREVLTAEQATAIIGEYQSRRRPPDQAFAEWYSIDPPFPAGVTSMLEQDKGHRPGEYVNGGIMPLVGGELAQGAFRWDSSAYGFDILQRYYSLIAGTGASYLWYYPIGQPGISGAETLPTDGWGSSAMLAALVEGAAGVRDEGVRFDAPVVTPRWAAAPDVASAAVTIRYGASDGYVAYRWERTAQGLRLTWTGTADTARVRLLLPPDAPDTVAARLDGAPVRAEMNGSGENRTLDLGQLPQGTVDLTW